MRTKSGTRGLGLLLILTLAAGCGGSEGANGEPLAADFNLEGKDGAQWSASWWQWFYAQPGSSHPIFDTADCGQGQSGDVWFLGGRACTLDQATAMCAGEQPAVQQGTRTCNVPLHTYLFFPIINSQYDNVCWATFGLTQPNTGEQNQAGAKAGVDTVLVSDLSLEVDGKAVTDLAMRRYASPIFSYSMPVDDVYGVYGLDLATCDPPLTTPATVPDAAADGYYAMLAPFADGNHTIHFKGKFGTFSLDITYNIHVGG